MTKQTTIVVIGALRVKNQSVGNKTRLVAHVHYDSFSHWHENKNCALKPFPFNSVKTEIQVKLHLWKTANNHQGRAMRKRVSGHMRTAKAQIRPRIRIRAVWSGTLLSAKRIIGQSSMYQWRENAKQMILCECLGWTWLCAFCTCRRHIFDWRGPYTPQIWALSVTMQIDSGLFNKFLNRQGNKSKHHSNHNDVHFEMTDWKNRV